MQIETIKKVTITEMIMEQLANKITSGELKPGEKLPTERELAERLGVTRSRVREALRALALIGLIEIKVSGGSFVTETNGLMPEETVLWIYHNEIHNVHDVYSAREHIESEIYRLCYENRTEEIIGKIEDYLTSFEEKISMKYPSEDLVDIIEELDLYVAEHCGNSIYFKLMQTMILLRREVAIKILKVSESRKSALLNRSAILEAFKQDDVEIFKNAMKVFFEKSVSDLLFKE